MNSWKYLLYSSGLMTWHFPAFSDLLALVQKGKVEICSVKGVSSAGGFLLCGERDRVIFMQPYPCFEG